MPGVPVEVPVPLKTPQSSCFVEVGPVALEQAERAREARATTRREMRRGDIGTSGVGDG